MKNISLEKYTEFVKTVTSPSSENLPDFKNRLDELAANVEGPQINVPLLITAGFGLGSEGGEFQEIVKKLLFHGKPLTEDNLFHLKRELGDVIWYWINACRALNIDPNDVISENVEKLKARYPGGEFDVWYSENRKAGDI